MLDAVEFALGTALPALEITLTRADLLRYCAASGDFNTIHWSQRHADAAGLPDVIAHGMFTMALAARVAHEWTGDPGRTEELSVRFSRPVPVPDTESGAVVVFSGQVTAVDDRVSTVALEGRLKDQDLPVLQHGRAVLRRR